MPTSATTADAPPGLAIRYPTTLIDTRRLGGAQHLLLRPVLPQDESLMSAFLLAQSAGARRNRFHAAINPSPRLCRQLSQVDDRLQLALVVCTLDAGLEQLVAEARYCVVDEGRSGEFALMVDERWQGQGVGGWALRALQQAAARAGLAWLEGEVLADNRAMLSLAQRCGFACIPDPRDDGQVRVRRRLSAVDASTAGAGKARRSLGLWRRLGRALTARAHSLRCVPLTH
ncbi:MAG: GNAT family N-acetyltransferase [Rubrivivax sp.]|nr:GNAT family N-acetyltransferase [Rubrivivax sp.]